MKSRFVFENGSIQIVDTPIIEKDGVQIATLKKADIDHVKYVDFAFDHFTASVGEEGWLLTNGGLSSTLLTRFRPREDQEKEYEMSFVGCMGFCRNGEGQLAIITTLRTDFHPVIGVKDGQYYGFPRFYMDGDEADDDIVVYYYSTAPDYSAMAKVYRNYQLTVGGCEPLKDRVARDSRLKKAADSIAVRIRQGWKPVPSPVEEQTPETEPEMYAACTFDRAADIAREFRKQGIPSAEFCLVGWNIGGHDGRFPQIFPADPRLGGEERLKALIQTTKELGYGIVCHDDATAAYRIADCFDEEYLLKNKDGNLHKRPTLWGGGRPYKICPRRQYERFEVSNQEKLAELGFEGLHYIDVMTILPVLKCYDPAHPLSRKESVYWYEKIMELSRQKFGGFSSESGYDYAAKSTDYVLYCDFKTGFDIDQEFCDEMIPFWHIVYHGIMLYNPSTFTLNYTAKGVKNRLKYMELGGRPLVCFYANFATGMHWMGREDFICDTDEQLQSSVNRIKVMAEDYELLAPERYEFIEEHKSIGENVFETVYANGTRVIVDYNKETFEIIR